VAGDPPNPSRLIVKDFGRRDCRIFERRMHGADDAGHADDLVATMVDAVRFDKNGILVQNFLSDLSAESLVALAEDALEISFKQGCDIVGHDFVSRV
jgi:hypothetical protein